MAGITHQDAEQLSLSASISNHVVRMLHAYTGRGPTKAWTSFDADLITVVLRDTLTKGERSLVANGRRELVLQTRKAYQDAMADELIAGVQERTGRTVIAFLSENHIDPDIGIENFVLAPNGASSALNDDS
jgi:uncharacterized protein YbcI